VSAVASNILTDDELVRTHIYMSPGDTSVVRYYVLIKDIILPCQNWLSFSWHSFLLRK